MKKINIIFTVTALLAFAPIVGAQTDDWSINGQIKDSGNHNANPSFPPETNIPVQIDETNKVAYSKNISQPFSDGTYWIKLETFATGSAATILTSTPSDIILILDSSSSMAQQDYGADDGEYKALPIMSFAYNTFSNTNVYGESFYGGVTNNVTNLYYKHTDGNYYRVSRGGNAQRTTRYLSYTVSGTPYYLNNNVNGGQPTTTVPTGVAPTGNDATIWTGVLYTTGKMARIDALKNAVNEFIDSIYQNDFDVTSVDSGYDGNRIAIVTYDASAYKLTSSYSWETADAQRANWFDIGGSGVRDNLKNAVLNMSLHNYTRPELGMREAIDDLLDGTPETKRSNANLTVVVFTDGVPAQQSTGGNGNNFDSGIANNAVHYGYEIKQTYGATLFTIGLLDKNSTNDHVKRGVHFLDLLSSNYPKSDISNGGTWEVSGNTVTVPGLSNGSATDKESSDYFQLVDEDTNLSSIFDMISQQAGGSANQSLSAATSTVDVVSNSFILPEGVFEDGADIKSFIRVFTASLDRIENGKYYFNTEILINHSDDEYQALDDNGAPAGEWLDIDESIDVELVGNNGIKVVGFDYSANFCGPVYEPGWDASMAGAENHIDHYQGHELIIMIPIKMNRDAVGGPNVDTNVEGSGIYIPDQTDPLVSFISPHVSLPYNLYIQKEGLQPGESAKFKLERASLNDYYDDEGNLPEDFSPANITGWSYVSTVFVTQPMGDTSSEPIVKVRGLPSTSDDEGDYIYRISEEDWAWSYHRDKTPQYTDKSKVDNPFRFENDKKDGIDQKVRHAESKVTNIFNGSTTTKVYIDSKTNKASTDTGNTNTRYQ